MLFCFLLLIIAAVDQLSRLGKRELVFLLLFTCSFVVSVLWRFLFLLILGMGCAFFIVALPGPSVNYFTTENSSLKSSSVEYGPFCVGSGRKLWRKVFSGHGSVFC